MSQPVIPERYKDDYETAWHHEKRTLIRELGAAEAKVAELEAKFAEAKRLRLYNLDHVTDLLKQNALWQADNREKAAIIERLTEGIANVIDILDQGPVDMDGGVTALNAEMKLRELLSKQEPK